MTLRAFILTRIESLCRGGIRSRRHWLYTVAALYLAALICPRVDRATWRGLARKWRRADVGGVVAWNETRRVMR